MLLCEAIFICKMISFFSYPDKNFDLFHEGWFYSKTEKGQTLHLAKRNLSQSLFSTGRFLVSLRVFVLAMRSLHTKSLALHIFMSLMKRRAKLNPWSYFGGFSIAPLLEVRFFFLCVVDILIVVFLFNYNFDSDILWNLVKMKCVLLSGDEEMVKKKKKDDD